MTKRLVVFNNKENSFMNKIKCTLLIFIFTITTFYGQNTKRETSIGFHYGFGNEIKNKKEAGPVQEILTAEDIAKQTH